MTGQLAPEVAAALARVAAGRGRTPTVAHPSCTCTDNGVGRRHDGDATAAARRGCVVHGTGKMCACGHTSASHRPGMCVGCTGPDGYGRCEHPSGHDGRHAVDLLDPPPLTWAAAAVPTPEGPE